MGSSDSLHRFTLNFPSGYIKAYPCCVFILSAFTQRHIPEQRLGCILAGQPQIYHNPYPTRNDTRPPRVIYSSSTSFRPHSRLIRSSHSYIYLPLGIAGSVTATHADGFTFFRLRTEVLPQTLQIPPRDGHPVTVGYRTRKSLRSDRT